MKSLLSLFRKIAAPGTKTEYDLRTFDFGAAEIWSTEDYCSYGKPHIAYYRGHMHNVHQTIIDNQPCARYPYAQKYDPRIP